jgi:hypothetical protein
MSDGDWIKANQRVLAAEISRLQALIAGEDMGNAYGELEAARAAMPCPPAMDTLVATLGLSLFERDVRLAAIIRLRFAVGFRHSALRWRIFRMPIGALCRRMVHCAAFDWSNWTTCGRSPPQGSP